MFISSLLFHLVDFKKSQHPNYYSFQFFKIIHVLERGAIYVCIAGNSHPWLQNINTEGAIYTSWFTWISVIFGLWFSYTFYERYKVDQFWFQKVIVDFQMFSTFLNLFVGYIPGLYLINSELNGGFQLVIASGLIISVGVFFFISDGHIPFAHAIWHLFANISLFVQFIAIYIHLT